jgi:predicted DCC family thiol-disulfide oxidoreductase YuxK
MSTHTILYDPDCGFCRVCVAVVLRWDRRRMLRPVSLTSTEGEALLAGMAESERMASWHLVDSRWLENGAENAPDPNHLTIRSAGAAFSPLFRLLPGGAPFALITDRFPRAAEAGYSWVADHRTALGRLLPAKVKRWADRVISESAADSR